MHHQVGARQERLVYRLDEIGGRHEKHRRQLARDLVDPQHDRVGRAVDVDRVGIEGRRAAPYREALDLVDQHHGERAPGGDLGDRVLQQPHDVALALAQHVARESVRIDLDQGRGAVAGQRQRGHLRQPARESRLAGSRRTGKHDQPVRQTGELGQLAAVLKRQQRLAEQPLLDRGGHDDRVPVPVMVLRGQHVQRQHPGRQRWNARCHQLSGRWSSGHSICEISCMLSRVSSASSNRTSGSVRARMVSRIESNMCTRTRRASRCGSSLKC